MNTTTIKQGENSDRWFWHTQGDNGEIIADQGQGNGYATSDDALNGFLSSQGFPDWKPGRQIPDGYTLSAQDHGGSGYPQVLIVRHGE